MISTITVGHVCTCSHPIVLFQNVKGYPCPVPTPAFMWLLDHETGKASVLSLNVETGTMEVVDNVPEGNWQHPAFGHWAWPPHVDPKKILEPFNDRRPYKDPTGGAAVAQDVQIMPASQVGAIEQGPVDDMDGDELPPG